LLAHSAAANNILRRKFVTEDSKEFFASLNEEAAVFLKPGVLFTALTQQDAAVKHLHQGWLASTPRRAT
jgi:hypothetical protein